MKIFFKLLIIFAFLSTASYLSAEVDNSDPPALASAFLKLMQKDDFDQAARLFHYPDTYTVEKREGEFRSVRDALKRHKDQLGNITELLTTIPKGDYLGSGISGAEIEYWSKQSGQPPSIIVPCRFQKLNFGVIRITFCKINERLEIQSVDFSFLKSEKSIKMLEELNQI